MGPTARAMDSEDNAMNARTETMLRLAAGYLEEAAYGIRITEARARSMALAAQELRKMIVGTAR